MTILGSLASSAMKLGSQVIQAATSGLDRLANRQEFEAVVAAAVLVACADGKISPEEKTAAVASATAHPALKSFPASEVLAQFDDLCKVLGMDRDLGIQMMIEKVHKVTALDARARIIDIATKIAGSDGDFSEVEKEMINKIRG